MQQKQETFIKFGNLTEGKIFGRLRIPLLGKKGNMEIQKIARKRKADFWTKNPSTRTALKGLRQAGNEYAPYHSMSCANQNNDGFYTAVYSAYAHGITRYGLYQRAELLGITSDY